MLGLAHGAMLLAPAKDAFDLRASRLRHVIARVPRGARVDGAFPPLAGLIPTALRLDLCPVAESDRGDGGLVVGEKIPGLAAFVDDVAVVIKDSDGAPVFRRYSQMFSIGLSSGE